MILFNYLMRIKLFWETFIVIVRYAMQAIATHILPAASTSFDAMHWAAKAK